MYIYIYIHLLSVAEHIVGYLYGDSLSYVMYNYVFGCRYGTSLSLLWTSCRLSVWKQL